ncbi:beta-lactamase family protein [Nonomuraea sp. NBC_01738]|uniref:serine hydrolase domain-containing protein n=1 Tax=Nonomuraea sp. NBC_01738 TaxID=2976003 RepID=UPI002E12C6A8|nr:beta-lactamase family protein [Nonomuraea sp. NBC_01738]
MPRLHALISAAGYTGDEPIAVGIQHGDAPPALATHGEPLTATTLTYAASLSKQMTAACAALLTRRGDLDPDSPLSPWLPHLPPWAHAVRIRHLIHHTAALPPDTEIDPAAHTPDRTSGNVIRALTRFPRLRRRPGDEHAYSNAGYVCLAAVVEQAAGMPIPAFARRHLFTPLRMNDTRYWPGPAPAPPGAAPLLTPHPAPLSLGDGGVWTTLTDLLRWSQALNNDELGISPLLQTPGHLNDATPLDYAWGLGVRSHAGHTVYRHGGGWIGLRALHARIPALGLSVALLATRDHTERRIPLLDSLLTASLQDAP